MSNVRVARVGAVHVVRSAGFLGAIFATLACGRIVTVIGVEFGGDGSSSGTGVDGSVDGGSDAGLDGACSPASVTIDIASGTLTGGFSIQMDPTAPGGEYLSPPAQASLQAPGDASADYAFNLSCAGEYFLWGRIHGPGPYNNTFWLSLDGEPPYEWRLSTGVAWFWRITTNGTQYGVPIRYTLDAGSHSLVIRNSASGVGLAGLVVAIRGYVPAGNDTPCDPPHSIELADGGCWRSCGSQGGTTCDLTLCAGLPLLSSYDCGECCIVPADAGGDGGADATSD
jgi:hypothetical protein